MVHSYTIEKKTMHTISDDVHFYSYPITRLLSETGIQSMPSLDT